MKLQFAVGSGASRFRPRWLALAVLAAYQGGVVGAEPTIRLQTVEVIGTTPLPGIGLPIEKVPANVQTVKGKELEEQHSLTIADYMAQNMTGVNVNETQNNPFQPNVNFRGFTASPLLGTPQGLSVYQDGVRINEPFGDVVSWDLIPMNALANMSLMPGSNPLFGLNTLGGAISLQTKRGYTHRGGAVELSGGSWGRYNAQAEYGGVAANGVDYFISGNYFDEDGWRDASPSEVRQVFGQLGWRNASTDLSLSMSLADNDLIGNGLVQKEFLSAQSWEAINTKPDQTENKLAFFNVNASHWLNDATMLSGNAYYRKGRTRTLNGDVNDDVDDADFNADCTSFADPEDAESGCGGALNRSKSKRVGYGATAQLNFNQDWLGHQNLFIAGLGYDRSRTDFEQSTEFGDITATRGVAGAGIFGEEGEVALRGVNRTLSVFATDTFSFNDIYHLTLSGRYNHTRVENRDQLIPDASNPESLTGDHSFNRFNPAIGLAITPSKTLSFYASYNEGSRAPTAIELGCANPNQPCKLPNAMAGDPPLDMVVSKTFEGGVRGKITNGIGYSASLYRTQNTDDIQFIAANSSGAGYFDNVGKTRRLGVDLGVNGEVGTFRWSAGYSYIKATYQSRFDLVSEVNSSREVIGVDDDGEDIEVIHVQPGNKIPGIPQHQFKLRGEWQALPQWTIGTSIVAFSDQYSHGNENNDHDGAGSKVAGYAVVNLDARYRFANTGWQVFAKVNNVFDKKYHTGGMLGETFFEADGTFMNGDDDFSALVAPGAPRAAWVGVRYEFGKSAGR
ncbi:MAG: TonB-dependent receptor [Rhodocyclaceae bacterium]|nr:TonB-dependent receptor [Rhodocyclaceae bacterium]